MEKIIIRTDHTTSDILCAVHSNNFKLFQDNFDKNNGTMPYMDKDKIRYITVENDNGIVGILAYALFEDLKKYRIGKFDKKHLRFAHIFDIEVLSEHRGQNFAYTLINMCIRICKEKKQDGITLMAKNWKLSLMYTRKFGFTLYDDSETDEICPMMELQF